MINDERGESMKFGDKLIQLRKKSGLSQEELAAKLNVSRQSVSKWESNNTYPETDKIVQICNIFDCTMDDLINENIKDITTIERKNKNQININFDSLLEFVTKTVNMFYSMTFLSGLKCLIELAIIATILIIIGVLGIGLLTNTISSIFSFMPLSLMNLISSVIEGILKLAWFIISLIVLIHIFKIRYLNYYEQISSDDQKKNDTSNNSQVEEKSTLQKEKIKSEKQPRIIIRDKEPFAFLNIFAKIIMWFIKSVTIIIGLFFAFILLLGIIGLVVSISLSAYSKIFIGTDISIIGIILSIGLILYLIIHFILDSKVKIKTSIILFFTSIIITGVGAGIIIISIKDFKIKDNMDDIINLKTNEIKLAYKDNLIIKDVYPRSYVYKIDNTLVNNEIIVQNKYDPRFNKLYYNETIKNGLPQYTFYLEYNGNIKDIMIIVLNDLKHNIFRDYSTYVYMDDISITANAETINKLMNNLSKVYIYDKEETEGGYIISNISNRIISVYSECVGEYNALTGEIESEDYCKCIKEIKEIDSKQTIEYSCHFNYPPEEEDN